MLKVEIVEAQGLAAPPEATPCAVLAVGKERLKTGSGKGVDPVWEEEFVVDQGNETKIILTVWNEKVFLGLAPVDLEIIPLDGSKHWYTLSGRRDKNDVVSGEICVSCIALNDRQVALKTEEQVREVDETPAVSPKEAEKLVKQKVAQVLTSGAIEIDLTGLQIANIPPSLSATFAGWVNMDLGFNKFNYFPLDLNKFQQLEELWLSGNQITQFPTGIKLPSLRVLYLNGNQLIEIPDHITQLSNLEKLDIANNRIKNITKLLGNMKKLAELFLSGNPLGTVPGSIGNLDYLEILDLSSCEIISLPNEFPGMTRLLELNLGNNQLTRLPTEFGRMSRLVSLNLCDNRLTELPVSMGSCSHLDSVILDRNPIQDKELLRKYEIGTDHLLDYLGKKLFAQNQLAKKKQREAAKKKAANKLREELKKKEAPPAEEPEEEGFVEEMEEEVAEVQLTPEEKYAKLRGQSQKLVTDCRNEIITLKRALQIATQLEEVVPIAKAIRNLIPHMNVARQQMAPIPKPQPPTFFGNEDKVTQLKKTTAVAIKEFETVLNGIFNVVCGNTTMEQLVPLSGVVVGSLSILQGVNKTQQQ